MKIEKKIQPKYFEEIQQGKKKFELRLADFKIKPRDILILQEWDPKNEKYTGKKAIKKIDYVLKTKDMIFWPEEDIEKYGFQIIQFK